MRGRVVSFLSLVIGGSEEEEHGEKMEAVALSLTEATEESKAVSRKTIIYTLVTKKMLKCNAFESFIFILVANDWSSKCPSV